MRITEGMMSDNFVQSYDKLSQSISKLQVEEATGYKINTLSDDVSGSLQIVKINTDLKKNATYTDNVATATSYLNNSLSALDSVRTEVENVISAVTSANNALNSTNMDTLLQSIKNSMAAIVQSLNTKQNGMYLFGGTNCTSAPFSVDTDGKGVVTANDISGQVKVPLSQNVTEAMNIPGTQITATGIITAINKVINDLKAGTAPDSTAQSDLQNAYSSLTNVESLAGGKVNRLTDLNTMLTNQKTILTSMLNNTQNADTVQLQIDLSNQQYLLDASSKAFGQSTSKSLLDYLPVG